MAGETDDLRAAVAVEVTATAAAEGRPKSVLVLRCCSEAVAAAPKRRAGETEKPTEEEALWFGAGETDDDGRA